LYRGPDGVPDRQVVAQPTLRPGAGSVLP
jgi:hypothetical protein